MSAVKVLKSYTLKNGIIYVRLPSLKSNNEWNISAYEFRGCGIKLKNNIKINKVLNKKIKLAKYHLLLKTISTK